MYALVKVNCDRRIATSSPLSVVHRPRSKGASQFQREGASRSRGELKKEEDRPGRSRTNISCINMHPGRGIEMARGSGDLNGINSTIVRGRDSRALENARARRGFSRFCFLTRRGLPSEDENSSFLSTSQLTINYRSTRQKSDLPRIE